MANRSNDFRDWDIAPETSYSGRDELGFPYYLWRESADNRLTLGRPRYCCITPIEGVLCFAFFNPSENVRSTGATIVAAVGAALVTVGMFGLMWHDYTSQPTLPYHMDPSVPPFLALVATFLFASAAAMLLGAGWYVLVTVVRWLRGRFKGDGSLFVAPIALLDGFQVISASEAGVESDGQRTGSGRGLSAVFSNGTQVILTGNSWTYRSIADQHSEMTRLFRHPRDELLKNWENAKEQVQRDSRRSSVAMAAEGVPDTI